MTSSTGHVVVGLGEFLWDCYGDERRVGGAPANVAFHAQQLGNRGVVASRVGDDEPGRGLLTRLAECGLETRYVQIDSERPTGRVTIEGDHPGSPSYRIHDHVAWDALDYNTDLAQIMRGAAAVCFGTLAQRHDRSRDAISQALRDAGNALIVYDVNLRQAWYERAWIERSMRACQVLKLNEPEVAILAQLLRTNTSEPLAFAQTVRDRFDVALVCITRAERGCLAAGPDGTIDLPGEPVDVIDAVGAGDAFCAALIHGVLRDWPLARTAHFANRFGGLVASRAGAMPMLRDECAALTREVEERFTA